MTSNEQHFKRDAWLSGRHRTWGYNAPAMDIDFLLVEYDKSVPQALIDYKHIHAILDLTNVGAKTLCNLGNMAKIPAFIVQYGHSNQNGWWGEVPEDSKPYFVIWPLNEHASQFMLTNNFKSSEQINELAFVEFLYQIRGRKIPQFIVDIITKQ